MSNKFIVIILFLFFSSCSNSQNAKTNNYTIHSNSSSKTKSIEVSILKANNLFEAYTNKNPKEINLFILDSIAHLKHNPTTELKDKPEAYLSLASEELTKIDTVTILEAFKNKLDGTTFVQLDSLGNAISYLSGFQKLNLGENTTVISTTKKKNGEPKVRIVRLNELKEPQVINLAMKDYNSINKPIDPNIQFLSFLWLNFFYEYFEVNESSDPTVKPEWLLNFSVIDAADLKLSNDFKLDQEKLSHLKVIFNQSKDYVLEFHFDATGRHNLFVPRRDEYYSNKWKYVILNLSHQFTLEDKTFNQMILTVSYLKDKYGNDVIKNLTKWYLKNDRGPLLITTFLRENYKVKTNINDMNQSYLDWVKGKKY